MSKSTQFDAIVIGSGITGGWAAKEFTEKGLKTLVLERGGLVEHQKGYTHEFTPPWQAPNQGLPDRELDEREYPIQSKIERGAFSWANRHYWINDRENPYEQVKPFRWHRTNVLGGRSLTWGRQSYRWGDDDFRANARDGHGNDWPIRYADLAPWYTHVEKFIGVSGQAEGMDSFPDGHFLPPMEMTAVERALKQRIEAKWQDRRLTIGRVANLTVPHNGRGPCQNRSICNRGCSFGAYFSSLSATLPAAQKTGRLTVRTDSVVEAIEVDPRTRQATGVRVIDAKTGQRMTFKAKVVFLCASTFGSVQILLQSRSAAHPNGIGNHSDALGRYLIDHHGVGAFAEIPGFDDSNYKGRRATGVYMPRFRNLGGQDADADFTRGYGFQGGAMRDDWTNTAALTDDFGAGMKRNIARPGRWIAFLGAFGEQLPQAHNRVTLNDKNPGGFGLPQLSFDVAYGENERRMAVDAGKQAEQMLLAAGAKRVQLIPARALPGVSIHEMGGARMGHDPAESVLNGRNQVHGVRNLFVTDGSAMASGGTVNPSLTYMALTARAVDYAVAQLKAGRL
ncbi:GMC family oxidoreductase [Pseudoduganella namucuonensis]|uniref:Choline dehydrogenase n=1 Tax=Pseudoduganella namucuonensis TaxID=1035707 RepID=A0A1I7H1L6_9BURK|nr:GMC family oxidoreductase [Pseudoduganella namucuonensis]SFU54396.1 Choline dehydrogenase [Pseudoduganella namucuonensis]